MIGVVAAGCAVVIAFVVFGAVTDTPEERFAEGICTFLSSQPEMELQAPRSTVVGRYGRKHCIDTSPQPPWYGASARYRWTGDADEWPSTASFFRRNLTERGWGRIRGTADEAQGLHRLSATTVRAGKRIQIVVTWDDDADEYVYTKRGYELRLLEPAERRRFWVEIQTSRSLQDAAPVRTVASRATLPR